MMQMQLVWKEGKNPVYVKFIKLNVKFVWPFLNDDIMLVPKHDLCTLHYVIPRILGNFFQVSRPGWWKV